MLQAYCKSPLADVKIKTPNVARVSARTDASLLSIPALVGGSDARIIMGDDEAALVRLWRENRGEVDRRTFLATSSSSSGS